MIQEPFKWAQVERMTYDMILLQSLHRFIQRAFLPSCVPVSALHAPRVTSSRCLLVVINMQDCASVREMLFSTSLSVHLSHSWSSSFISAEQQDGRAHLGLIVGLPLLTNPAHCQKKRKERNNQGLEKGMEGKKFGYIERSSKSFSHTEITNPDRQAQMRL